MSNPKAALDFQDDGTFDSNLAVFTAHLVTLDSDLASTLASSLTAMADEAIKREEMLNQLMTALIAAEALAADGESATTDTNALLCGVIAASTSPAKPPVGWFLEQLEIEGFRGINNEGTPLVLQFKPDAVSSISAPNGVGKSSIFDAMNYALRRSIPKLEDLAASEKGQEYYLNRFHKGGIGRISLTVKPRGGRGNSDQLLRWIA